MLLARRSRQHQHHLHEKPHLFRRYYRWLIWFALTLYLLSAAAPHAPLILPLSLHGAVRSLSELPVDVRSPDSFQIYVYDLPARFNRDWLRDPRCTSHLFAAEVAIHEALLRSAFFTADPVEADLFFVPVYVSCNFSVVNGFPALGGARGLILEAISLVASHFPFWNRTGGRDHVFVASHDYGTCFHSMEHVAIAHGVPEFMKQSIVLQTFGVQGRHVCQDLEHVLIPPYIPPEVEELMPAPEKAKRDIWVFFRGKMEVHPKNVSGRFYGKRVRTEIWNRFSGNDRFYLRRKRFEGYQHEIGRSVFCLCPLGWAPWSPRLVEAVALGCVPVIIADGIRLPFPDAVPWPLISVTVSERHVSSLERILDHVSATNLSEIQRRLWDPAVRRALLFHRPMQEGDAMWWAMRALEGKLDRSWRRRRRRRDQLLRGRPRGDSENILKKENSFSFRDN